MKYKSSPSRMPILIIFLVSAVAAVGYTIVRSRFTPQPVGINEVTSSGTISLSVSPFNLMQRPNLVRTLNINVDSGSDKLTAVQLELEFDPTLIELTELTSTGYLSTTLSAATVSNGVARVTYGANVSSGGIQGSGTIATVKYKSLKPGNSTINFGPNCLAAAISSNTNVLKSVTGTSVKTLHPGDINGDDKVTLADYNIFLPAYGTTDEGRPLVDLNSSGKVDLADYNILVANYGKTY